MNRQGYNWMPKHDQYRGRVLEHIRRVKPAFGVILTEDYMPISEAWAAHPHKICARVYEIDDGAGTAGRALNADPRGAASTLLQRYLDKIAQWRTQAAEAGRPFPDPANLYISAWNEPNQHTSYARIAEGNIHLCEMATMVDVRVLAIKLGVGHPSGQKADGSVDWSAFESSRLQDAILEGGHVVGLHAYFQVEGPNHVWQDEKGAYREDYPYLAGRHHGWPLPTPLVLDETGVDGGIFQRNVSWGWQNYGVPAPEYAAMLQWTHDHMDARVLAQCPYGLDYQNDEWWGFNYVDALDAIESWAIGASAPPPDNTVHIPAVVVQPVAPEVEPSPHGSNWERSLAFVRRMEGGWADNPADPGGATMYGITMATYTRWRQKHGYPPPTKGDLRAISDEEANRIYYEWYWLASGADKMAWPMCLAHFDLAVNGGVERAAQAYAAAGHDFLQYMAWRLRWYTRIEGWPVFGAAWVRRCAELLDAAR